MVVVKGVADVTDSGNFLFPTYVNITRRLCVTRFCIVFSNRNVFHFKCFILISGIDAEGRTLPPYTLQHLYVLSSGIIYVVLKQCCSSQMQQLSLWLLMYAAQEIKRRDSIFYKKEQTSHSYGCVNILVAFQGNKKLLCIAIFCVLWLFPLDCLLL